MNLNVHSKFKGMSFKTDISNTDKLYFDNGDMGMLIKNFSKMVRIVCRNLITKKSNLQDSRDKSGDKRNKEKNLIKCWDL